MAEDQIDGGIRPVVFVGLGSTGAKIVSKIHDNLSTNADPMAARFYRYFNITSEVDAEPNTSTAVARFSLAAKQMPPRQAINPLWNNNVAEISTDFKKWWYTEKDPTQPWVPQVKSLETGSGGMRSIGRALLHSKALDQSSNLVANFGQIVRSIHDEVEALPVEDRPAIANSIDCYLFGLLAGGTCSGTLLDVALLLKAGMGPQTNLFGVFLLGDVCYDGIPYKEIKPIAKRTQLTNTNYALAELAIAQSPTGWGVLSKEWPRRVGALNLGQLGVFDSRPFANVTLIGAQNDDGFSFNASGNQFRRYLDFIAQYYCDFFMSEAVHRQVGRAVDQAMADAVNISQRYPSRPNDFQRIGYMCIRVPEEKIDALLRHEIADSIGLAMFKNAQDNRCKSLRDAFCTAIGWDLLTSEQSEFSPRAEDEPIFAADAPLPDTAQQFEETWKQTIQSVKDYYAPRTTSGSAEVQGIAQRYRAEKWQPALDKMLDNLLGQVADEPLSVGSAKWVIESLQTMVKDRIAALTATEKQLQSDLYKDGPESLMSQFDACLEAERSLFPAKSSFNPLAYLARRSWAGQPNVAQALSAVQDKLQAYSICVVTKAALEPLMDELRIQGVVRTLVASHAARDIFESAAATANTIFTEADTNSITQEIISDKESIGRCFVQPILSSVAPGATLSRRDTMMRQVGISWSANSSSGVRGAWMELAQQLRKGGGKVSEAETVLEQDPVKQIVDRLRSGLKDQFNRSAEHTLTPAIEELSVWEALRLYVKKAGGRPDATLQKMFKVYVKRAKHFTKLNGNQAGDGAFQPTPEVFYLCNTQDAEDCFESMGIPNSETYLTHLMEQALEGSSIHPMENANPARGEIQLFLALKGELPYFYGGFEGMINLLRDPPIQETGDDKNWSDKRFPNWIGTWWKDCEQKPYFLSDMVQQAAK